MNDPTPITDPVLELKQLLADMRSYPVQEWMCGWLQRIIDHMEQRRPPITNEQALDFFEAHQIIVHDQDDVRLVKQVLDAMRFEPERDAMSNAHGEMFQRLGTMLGLPAGTDLHKALPVAVAALQARADDTKLIDQWREAGGVIQNGGATIPSNLLAPFLRKIKDAAP